MVEWTWLVVDSIMQAESIEVEHSQRKQQYNKADWFQRLDTEACYQHGWEQGSLLQTTPVFTQQSSFHQN